MARIKYSFQRDCDQRHVHDANLEPLESNIQPLLLDELHPLPSKGNRFHQCGGVCGAESESANLPWARRRELFHEFKFPKSRFVG